VGYLTTRHNEFLQVEQNYGPGNDGVDITPGTGGAMGAWTDLLGATASEDVYGIWLAFFNGALAGQSNPTLVDIGIDTAGGTSYSVLIPTLQAGSARSWGSAVNQGFYYYFPLFVPKGSRVAARAQQPLATAVSFTAQLMLLEKPTHPELVKIGTYVEAIGVDVANSRGTVLTFASPDARVQGPWVSLGLASKGGWFFQSVGGVDDSAISSNNQYILDFALGDAVNKRMLVDDQWFGVGSGQESAASQFMPVPLCYATIPPGSELFVRGTSKNGGAETNVNAMVYLVGGG
jgi:hypothetical protein